MQNQANLADNSHKGTISAKADKNLRNAINWLLCASSPKKVYHKAKDKWFEFKVNFITLTLPDTTVPVSDYDFKTKLLNPWLTLMRTRHGLKNYVWKMEFQKNGKLHLHITTDTFLHYTIIRNSWNKLLGKNNYLIDFAKKFGHTNPNSTDIHSVRKINNLAGYLAKYMSKQSADLKRIRGRIWGCNYELSRANKTSLFVDKNDCQFDLKCLMQKGIEWSQLFQPDKLTNELRAWGEIFYMKYTHWRSKISGPIRDKFFDTVNGLKNLYHAGDLFQDLAVV
jgi:ribosomal protein S17E